ncbi:fibronectin type III domain-containing protein [Nocardioides daejeonensis]|uniref:fibronectin type III domain-containing protein n=1 Tax=Nocardioides daejeonensis TaxID=1046556 RepID=UPI0013A57C24|nr:fibronectin type III domain-containing protein [Nocardioides daejeonensis]
MSSSLPATHPIRRLFVGAVAAALLVAPLSSSPSAQATPTADTAESSPTAPAANPKKSKKKLTAVRISAANQSLVPGAVATFTLTNLKTKKTSTVVVDGRGKKSATQVKVAPGRYKVTKGSPAIANGLTFSVSKLKPANGVVKVKKATKRKPKQIAQVKFTTVVAAPALQLQTGKVSPSSVDLSWTGPADASYVVRRTLGKVAAASPADGTGVSLPSATARSVKAAGLEPGTDYTFTLFGTASSGKALPQSSTSVATGSWDGSKASYALAPNTIAPQNFAALQAKALPGKKVSVRISAGNSARRSATPMPRIDAAGAQHGFARRAAKQSNCVVGAPFLVAQEVAGSKGFYGRIEACKGDEAIVNTNVGLSVVLSQLDVGVFQTQCLSLASRTAGKQLPNEKCVGTDTDGDGVSDSMEEQLGLNPRKADTDGDGLTDGEELNTYGTDPLNVDSDFDLRHDNEIWPQYGGTDPLSPDTDNDGCWDVGEIQPGIGRNPKVADSGDCFVGDENTSPGGNWRAGVEKRRAAWEAAHPARPRATQATTSRVLSSADDVDLDAARPTLTVVQSNRAKPKVECKGSGGTVVSAGEYINLVGEAKVNLDVDVAAFRGEVTWDITGGVEVGMNPSIKLNGKYECSLDLGKAKFQLANAPVPVNLTLAPLITASAEGSIGIEGPQIDVTFGLKSSGMAVADVDWTGLWSGYKLKTEFKHTTAPYKSLNVGEAALTMSGEIGLDLGVSGEVAFGWDNVFVTAKAGVKIDLVPASIEAEAKVRSGKKTSACAELSVGAKATISFIANATVDFWVLEAGADYEEELWTGRVTYPNASWDIGDCDD